jgi:hypothetical protein
MGSPVLRYRHLILLHTQMRNGCRCRTTIQGWPAEFGHYVLGYQPRFDKCRVLTKLIQELNCLSTPKPIKEKKAQAELLGKFNPFLSEERRCALHTNLTQISDEYTQMQLEEIQLPKGCLPS